MTVSLKALVLGSAAGGGVPQWNCRCRVCRLAWAGGSRVRPRNQSSVALSTDGSAWLLLNASPDLRQQIWNSPALHPRGDGRDSPIAAVLVTNGDVDHVTGLLSLRERQSFTLYGTETTLATLADNRVFSVMAEDCVPRRPIRLEESFEPLPGLAVTPFAVPGKVALWLEARSEAEAAGAIGGETETTIGLEIRAGDRRLYYVPGCAAVTPRLMARLDGADALFFDGTLFDDDEMIREGLGAKTGRRMGHISMAGPEGSIAALAGLRLGRRIFIHINNTNPALIEDGPERRHVEAAGWEVAYDGLEVIL